MTRQLMSYFRRGRHRPSMFRHRPTVDDLKTVASIPGWFLNSRGHWTCAKQLTIAPADALASLPALSGAE